MYLYTVFKKREQEIEEKHIVDMLLNIKTTSVTVGQKVEKVIKIFLNGDCNMVLINAIIFHDHVNEYSTASLRGEP